MTVVKKAATSGRILPLGRIGVEGDEDASPVWHLAESVRLDDEGFVQCDAADALLVRLSTRPPRDPGDPDPEHLVRLTPRACWWLKCSAEIEGARVRVRIVEYDTRGAAVAEWITLHEGACAIPVFTAPDHSGVALELASRGPGRFRLEDLRLVEARRSHERFTCLLCESSVTRSELVPVDELGPPSRRRWICPGCRRLPAREQEHRLLLRSLAGGEVHCPVCGGGFKTFLPWGGRHGRPRANARCPSCLSLERHRLAWLYFERYPELLRRTRRLLHVAPERCSYERLKALEWLDYVPCDLHMEGYHYGADVMNVDITRPPFPDESFDGVICSHVLEHVSDDRRALREILRLLEPEGWAMIIVPVMGNLDATWEDPTIDTAEGRAAAFGQWDHVRAYGRDYKERFLEVGFVEDAVDLEELASKATRFRYGINETELRLWRKPAAMRAREGA